MEKYDIPAVFRRLQSEGLLTDADIMRTKDGFALAYRSLADILARHRIHDFPGSGGQRLACNRFYDDWFMYAAPGAGEYTYGLLKLREQEHDGNGDVPADGDTPGVTVSFISFDFAVLRACLMDSTDGNRQRLNREINRVVAHRGQSHHSALKQYFVNPQSEASYLIAVLYTKHIASFAENGCLAVPEHYKEIMQQITNGRSGAKLSRVPRFIDELNQKAGRMVCDHEKIYIQNREYPDSYECAAILATHTGNTSVHSFAAEVLFHARFLIAIAKIRIPFLGSSVYDSAIRADMSIGDTELQGITPYYRENSRIVQEQYRYHGDKNFSTRF